MSLTIQSGGSLTIQGGGGGGGGGATVGTYANRPAAGNAGAIYICTDSPIAQWVDDGSAWRPMILGQALGTQVPAASAFTAFGSGATFSDDAGTIKIVKSGGAGILSTRGGAISLSSPSAYVEGLLQANVTTFGSFCWWDIMLRESATGAAIALTMTVSTNAADVPYQCGTVVNMYSGNSRTSVANGSTYTPNGPTAGRVRRSGANIIVSVSKDLVRWDDIYTVATSSQFSSAPDQVAFGVGSTEAATANLLHFKYGSL